ncbi:MAG: hypothetical protein CSB48_04805 [Proteobacteria bacterium]|nr:MAG: hypothetical protein CSB48_04805 [Pseudomonadota bacterium]
MTTKQKNNLAWALLALLVSTLAMAESKQLVEPTEKHKKKSTIDTFPLVQLDQEDLSDAVIEGGLEPTAAGNPEPAATEQLSRQDREIRSEYDHETITIKFNFAMPRFAPKGTVITQATEAWPNRTYHRYDTAVTER